jgi:hypothetical protein
MEERKDKQDAQRILLVKESIANAEKNLQTAKSLLAQLESKYTPQKKTYGVAEGGKIIEGTFDGQLMIGTDGRQYPVPANYASKSKLVEGDMLKLVITDDGNFIYKQIGPFKRKRLIGILKENSEEGGYVVEAEGKAYKVLLAAVTYHHANAGDEIALVIADNNEALWGAIENVTKKGDGTMPPFDNATVESGFSQEIPDVAPTDDFEPEKPVKSKKKKADSDVVEKIPVEKTKKTSLDEKGDIDEELTPDLAEMEAELKKQIKPNN